MSLIKSYKWFLDSLNPDEAHMHSIRKIVCAKETKYQLLEIMDTGSYGRCLVLDGKIQSSEADEFIYHEALVHTPILSHPDPKKIFIIGGGEGATLREILRYKSVESILMVDIDEEVVENCRRYLPDWHRGSFDDPRVEIKFQDAREYLENTKDTYDVIIIDISEPVEEGPAYLLYTKEFYNIVKERLSENGVISLQAGTTAIDRLITFAAVYKTMKMVFPVVLPYQAVVPSFGLPWGLIFASTDIDAMTIPPYEIEKRIESRINGDIRYYNGEIHQGQFLFPKFLKDGLEKEERIIEDNHPLYFSD
ncbi:MAG: polyamine aminopropyltransferase [Nitrospirota bacterium]